MGISDWATNGGALVESEARARNSAIGLFAEREFARARAEIADLASYRDYDDWLDSRQGRQIGLAMAGVGAATVCVGLSSFLEWRALTGAAADEDALDGFAGAALAMRYSRTSLVLAVISEFDFARFSGAVEALAGHGEYRGWLRHRRAMRAHAIAAGLRVDDLPVGVASFVEWCACLRQSASEAALDRYAQLRLEHLTSEPTAAE
jgi:hypothetical protein